MPSITDVDGSNSPPPPAPPIPLTPGPRAVAFHNLYTSALSSTLSSIPYNSFASCFPTISAANPSALRAMHTTMMERLDTFARAEFERICKERKVVEGLNSLEERVAEARRRMKEGQEERSEPPHLLPPTHILAAHLTPIYTQQQSQLNAKLQTTQSQNAILAEKLGGQRREIEGLMAVLEAVLADLERAGEKVGRGVDGGEEGEEREREGLDAEARKVEEVLMGMER